MKYYTSDLHLGHENIIKYCNRPFKDTEEMDKELIRKWNLKVKTKDEVFIVGDFAMGYTFEAISKYLDQLNGTKYLIIGNHDYFAKDKKDYDSKGFVWIKDIAQIKDGEFDVFLCHYPMVTWNKSYHGSIQLFGHVHNSPVGFVATNSYNVGVDVWNYEPVTLKEILNKHGYNLL